MDKNNLKLEFVKSPMRNYIVTYLEKEEDIVEFEVEMINNNPISGALNIEIRQFNDKIKVIYDITNKISIKEYLKNRTIKKNEFIAILSNIAKSILGCKNYFLNEKKYMLSMEDIFVNPQDLSIYLIYLPFKINVSDDMNVLYKNVVKNLIIDYVSIEEEGGQDILQKILTYIRKDDFSIFEFKEFLDKFGEDNLKVVYGTGKSKQDNRKISEIKYKDINTNANMNSLKSTELKAKENGIGKSKERSKLLSKKMLVIFEQLIVLGIIGLAIDIERFSITCILIVTFILVLDLISVIVLLVKNKRLNKENTSLKTGFIKRGNKKDSIKNSETSNREIVTEMSFETELLDDKTAFLVSKKAGTVEKIAIDKDVFRIGRLPDEVDYISDNRAIGKIHAEIRRDGERYYMRDLNSKNGTYINGNRINSDELYEIKNEDSIIFANSEFEFLNN